MIDLIIVVLMLLGGITAAASFYYPHILGFTSDHAIGAGIVGGIFLILCFLMALKLS